VSTSGPEAAARAQKAELRILAAQRRAAIPPAEAKAAALAIRDCVLSSELIPARATVSGYWPLAHECDPRPLLAALAARGRSLCLPVVAGRGQPLVFRHWSPGDTLRRVAFGLSEPLPDAPLAVPEVLLVPLLAFDRRGYRLGHGAGYYDRTLAQLRAQTPSVRAIGIAFALQEVAAVPVLPHDQPLDAIATEREFILLAEFL
jgi:5-formyltetrahydrofolate cyclo-ligase